MMYHQEKSPNRDGAAVKMSDRSDKTSLSGGPGAPGAPKSEQSQEEYPPDDILNKIAATPHRLMEKFRQEWSDVDADDLVDDEMTEVSPGLGLLAGLADAAKYQTCVSINAMQESTGGEFLGSVPQQCQHHPGEPDEDVDHENDKADSHSQSDDEDEEDDELDDEDDLDNDLDEDLDEDLEDEEEDDDEANSTSDGSPTGEGDWTELEDNASEDMDPCKLAALSSAFSTQISMAKLSRVRMSPYDGRDLSKPPQPSLGQFLLPLITDYKELPEVTLPQHPSNVHRPVIRNEDFLKVLSSASEFVTEHDSASGSACKQDVLRLFEKYGAIMAQHIDKFVPDEEDNVGVHRAAHPVESVKEEPVRETLPCSNYTKTKKAKKPDVRNIKRDPDGCGAKPNSVHSEGEHEHEHFSICNVFRNNIDGISAKELEMLQAMEVSKLCKLLHTLDPTGECLKPEREFVPSKPAKNSCKDRTPVEDGRFTCSEASKSRVEMQSERFEDVRRQIEQMYPGSFDDCPVDRIDVNLHCHNDKLLDKLISKIDEKIIPKEGRFGFDVLNNKRIEQPVSMEVQAGEHDEESENFQSLLLDSTSKVSDLLHYLQNWSVDDINEVSNSDRDFEHADSNSSSFSNVDTANKAPPMCNASFNQHLKELLQNFPGFEDGAAFGDSNIEQSDAGVDIELAVGCRDSVGDADPAVKRMCCDDQYLRDGGVCKSNGCHLEVAPLMRSVERYLMKHLNESLVKKPTLSLSPPPTSPDPGGHPPQMQCYDCKDCLEDTLDIRIMSGEDTDTSSNDDAAQTPYDRPQMLFDCDSVNVKDRFVSDDGLCPGGCANKTPCSAFRESEPAAASATMQAKANKTCLRFLKGGNNHSRLKRAIQGLNAAVKNKVPLDLEIVQKRPLFGEDATIEAEQQKGEAAADVKSEDVKPDKDNEHPLLSELRFIDLQAAWWELRVLILTVYRVFEMRPNERKENTIVAFNPTCHCCHCAYGRINRAAVMNMIGGLLADSGLDPQSIADSSSMRCTCARGVSGRKRGRGGKGVGRVKARSKMSASEGRCHTCTAKGRMLTKRVRPEIGTVKLIQELQSRGAAILCCCNQTLSALHGDLDFAQVTVFFEDESAPVKVDLLSGEIIADDQDASKDQAYFEECLRRHKKGIHVDAASQRAFKSACEHCQCQCKRPRFYTEKDMSRTILHIIDNFNRLAMRVLMHRLNALSLALVARHGAQLASTLANKSAPEFLLELSWRTQALMEGSRALGMMLGPKRHLLAHSFSLLMPDALLSAVYRRWADGPAANIVVQLCILMGRGEAPEKSVEALKAFASCLPVIRTAEALHKSINFVPRYDEYQPAVEDDQLERARYKYLREERTHLTKARRLYRNAIPPIGDDSPRNSVSSSDDLDDDVSQIALKGDTAKSCGEIQTTLTDDNLKIATAAIVAILDCNNASTRRRLSILLEKLINISKSKKPTDVPNCLPPENIGPNCFAKKNLINLDCSEDLRKIQRGARKKRPLLLKDKRRHCKALGVIKRDDKRGKSKIPSIDECESFQEVAKFCGITLNRGGKIINADQLAAKMMEYKNLDDKSAAQYERMVSRLNMLNNYDSVFDNNYTIRYLNQLASRSSINWDSDSSDIDMFINDGKIVNSKSSEDDYEDEEDEDDSFVIVEKDSKKAVTKLDSVEDLSSIADMIIEEDRNKKHGIFVGYIENNSSEMKMDCGKVNDEKVINRDRVKRYDGEDPEVLASRICNRLWFDAEKRADVQADAVRWLVATVKAGSVETMRVLTEFDSDKSMETNQLSLGSGKIWHRNYTKEQQEYFDKLKKDLEVELRKEKDDNRKLRAQKEMLMEKLGSTEEMKPVLNTSPSSEPASTVPCHAQIQPHASVPSVVMSTDDTSPPTAQDLRSRPSKRKLKSNPSSNPSDVADSCSIPPRSITIPTQLSKNSFLPNNAFFTKKWTVNPANYSFNTSKASNTLESVPRSDNTCVLTLDKDVKEIESNSSKVNSSVHTNPAEVHRIAAEVHKLDACKRDVDAIGNEDLSLIMANLAVSEEITVDDIVPENLTNILCDIVMTTEYMKSAGGDAHQEEREASPTTTKADRICKPSDSSKSPISIMQSSAAKSKISTEVMQRIADIYRNALALTYDEDNGTSIHKYFEEHHNKTRSLPKSIDIVETLAPPSSPQPDSHHSPPLHELSPSGSVTDQGNTHYQNRKLTALNQILKVFGVDMSSKIVNEDMTSEIIRKSQMVSALMEEDNIGTCQKLQKLAEDDNEDDKVVLGSSPPSTPKKRKTINSDVLDSDDDNVKHIGRAAESPEMDLKDMMDDVPSNIREAMQKGLADKLLQLPARFLDESMLTPETVEQIREVRISNNKKLSAGSKRRALEAKICLGLKCDDELGVPAWSTFWDSDKVTGEHPCDPTPEGLMREMIKNRDSEKGYTKQQFEKQLCISASEIIVAQIIGIMMPIEADYLPDSNNTDVKISKVLDGFRIEDYWEEIKPNFLRWRIIAVAQYWNLPAHYRMRKKKVVDCNEIEAKDGDSVKKQAVKKIIQCKETLTADVPMDQAYFVERYQAVNKQYCEKVMNNDYSGEDWVKTMKELQRLESKLKFAVNRAQQKQLNFEVREAELVAGKGLGKLINQSYAKKKDDVEKDNKVDKTIQKDKNDFEVKMNFKALKDYMMEYITNSDMSGETCDKDAKTAPNDKDKKAMQDDKGIVVVEDDKAIVIKDYVEDKPKIERGVRVVDGVAFKDGVPIKDSITIRDILGYDDDKLPQCGGPQKLLQEFQQNKTQRRPPQQQQAAPTAQVQQQNAANSAAGSKAIAADQAPVSAAAGKAQQCGTGQGKPAAGVAAAPKGKSLLKGCDSAGDGQHHHCLGDGAPSHAESCGSEEQNRCSRHPDAPRSNSHSNSSGGNGGNNNSDHPCNCCYCTVFGHAPPVTTPVSRNFNETRERLRLILNRKKQRSGRPNAVQQSTNTSQTTPEAESQEQTKGQQNPPSQTNQSQSASQAQSSAAAVAGNNGSSAPAAGSAAPGSAPSSTQNKPQQRQPPPGFSLIPIHPKPKPTANPNENKATANAKSKTVTPTTSEASNNSSRTSSTSSTNNNNHNGRASANANSQHSGNTLYEKGLALLADTKTLQAEKSKGAKLAKSNSTSSSNQTSSANSASPSPSPAGQQQSNQQKSNAPAAQNTTKKAAAPVVNNNNVAPGRSRQPEANAAKGKGPPKPSAQNQIQQSAAPPTSTAIALPDANTVENGSGRNNNIAFNAGLTAGLTDGIAAVLSIYSNSRTASTSRDTSAYSTSSICSGCSADTVLLEDTRDLNMLVEFIEGPGRSVNKVKKQAKKARQRAKKMIEKLVADRENLRQDILQKLGEAKYLRKEAIKFDKEIASRRKPQGSKGKKKQGNPGQLSTASESALEACAKATRAVATRAEDSVTSMREKLRRTEMAIERLVPTVNQDDKQTAKKKKQRLTAPQALPMDPANNKEQQQPTTTLIPNYNGQADIRLLANEHALLQHHQQLQQQQMQQQHVTSQQHLQQLNNQQRSQMDGAGGMPAGQQNGMVTIKRVMLPDRDEPGVTITAGGYEQSPYQYMGMFQYSSDNMPQDQQQQQQQQAEQQQQNKPQQKKASAPSWESTLAQINALSQSKCKKSGDKKKPQKAAPVVQQPTPAKKPPTSTPITRDSSLSLCSDVGQPDQLTKKQRRKQAALLLQHQEEEMAKAAAVVNESAAKKSAKKGGSSTAANENNVATKPNAKNTPKDDDSNKKGAKNAAPIKAKSVGTIVNDKAVVNKGVKGKNKQAEDSTEPANVKKKNSDASEVVLGSFSSLSIKGEQKKNAVSKGNNAAGVAQKPAGKGDVAAQKTAVNNKTTKGAHKAVNPPQQQQSNNAVTGKKGGNQQQQQSVAGGNKNQHQQQQQQTQWKPPPANKPLAVQGERIRLNADTTIEIASNKSNIVQPVMRQPVTQQHNHQSQPSHYHGPPQPPMQNHHQHHHQPPPQQQQHQQMSVDNDGPASCSIMEQLRSGVQVADLKLPPGITLTWVDPAKNAPNPNTAKSAIPSVKLTSAVPAVNRPTPPVVAPPAVIMVDTNRLQADRDKNNQPQVVNPLPPHPNTNMDPSQQRPVGSRQKKSKRRYKRPTQPPNLSATSSSTHITSNVTSNSNATTNNNPPTKMVTLRNPMFHPGPIMNLNESINTRRIPDPIPMPPSSNPGQATITPTSNGMYTIRNPLMSMVHARSVMEQQNIVEPPPPPVQQQSNSNYVNNANQEQFVASKRENSTAVPKSVVDSVNLNFTPNKDRGYSLFKQESEEADSSAVNHSNSPNYNSLSVQNPIGSSRSFSNHDPATNKTAVRMNDVPQGIPEPIGTPLGIRKADNIVDNSVIGNLTDAFKNVTCSSSHQGLYRPFGGAGVSNEMSDKVFGAGLFQTASVGREEQCFTDKQTGWPCQEVEVARKEKDEQARQATFLYRSESSTNCHHPQQQQQQQQQSVPSAANNVVEISLVPDPNHHQQQQLQQQLNNQTQHYRPMYGPQKTWGPYSEYPPPPPNAQQNFYSQYGGRFARTPQQNVNEVNRNAAIVSSHSSSSSGLLSGNSSVYDSVSNSSSNSPADSSVNVNNAVIPSENIVADNVVRMSPNRMHHVHHMMNNQHVQAPMLYNIMNQYPNIDPQEPCDQPLNLSTPRNNIIIQEQPAFNQELIPHASIMQDNIPFNQMPNVGYNVGGFNNTRMPINHEGFQSRMGSDGSYGFGFEQQTNSSGFNSYGSQYGDSGSGCSSLGAIGSQRVAFNGVARNSGDYFGDSGSVFAPDQSITNLNELDSTERDIETFKRFDFYFEPPKNKPKISLNLNDIALQPKMTRDK